MRTLASVLLMMVFGAVPAFGQTALETNAEVLTRLAVECAVDASGTLESLSLEAPTRLPFLRSGIVSTMVLSGTSVFDQDAGDHPRLTLSLENAGVTYTRGGRRLLNRSTRLAMSVRLVDTGGKVLHDEMCSPTFEDVIPANAIPGVENSTYPETRGVVPLSRWRRFVQPAVIAAASAAGTLLFFSLRSKRSDGG